MAKQTAPVFPLDAYDPSNWYDEVITWTSLFPTVSDGPNRIANGKYSKLIQVGFSLATTATVGLRNVQIKIIPAGQTNSFQISAPAPQNPSTQVSYLFGLNASSFSVTDFAQQNELPDIILAPGASLDVIVFSPDPADAYSSGSAPRWYFRTFLPLEQTEANTSLLATPMVL